MLKKIGLAAAALLCAVDIFSLSFSVNSVLWKNYTAGELERLASPVPSAAGGAMTGVSLTELFPVLYDAWSLDTGTDLISVPDLTGELQKMFLVPGQDGLELVYGTQTYRNIHALDIKGEVLETGPLEIWINWEGTELLRAEIQRYADLHELQIKVTEVPKPDSKLISITRGGGTVPDVIMVQSSYIDSLVRSGSIQNIDYMYPDGLQQLGKDAFTTGGKTWAVPFYYDTQLLFYNPNLIRGPANDWTLTDFETLCGRAGASGVIPSAWNAYSASFLIPFQMSFGKQRLIEPDGSIDITDQPSLMALEYVLRLKEEKLMLPMERDAMISLFVSGDAAMIISASYSIPHFRKLGIPFETAALPVNQTTGRRVAPLLDFKAFAVTKKSRNTTGARRLIEHLTGPGVQGRFAAEISKLPARESVFQLLEDQSPFFEVLKISADSGIIIPADKAFSVYKNTMWKMLRFAISGRMAADQVLEKTQELVNKNLENIY